LAINWLGVPRLAFNQHRNRFGGDRFNKISVTAGDSLQQSVRAINRFVQFVNGVRVITALKRQWCRFGKLAIFTNGLDQIGENGLPILNRFPNAVLHYPAFQINRLSGGRRQFDNCGILRTHRQVFPGLLARCSGLRVRPAYSGVLADSATCAPVFKSKTKSVKSDHSAEP